MCGEERGWGVMGWSEVVLLWIGVTLPSLYEDKVLIYVQIIYPKGFA